MTIRAKFEITPDEAAPTRTAVREAFVSADTSGYAHKVRASDWGALVIVSATFRSTCEMDAQFNQLRQAKAFPSGFRIVEISGTNDAV